MSLSLCCSSSLLLLLANVSREMKSSNLPRGARLIGLGPVEEDWSWLSESFVSSNPKKNTILTCNQNLSTRKAVYILIKGYNAQPVSPVSTPLVSCWVLLEASRFSLLEPSGVSPIILDLHTILACSIFLNILCLRSSISKNKYFYAFPFKLNQIFLCKKVQNYFYFSYIFYTKKHKIMLQFI